MQEILGNKGSSGDAPGMQEALGDAEKREQGPPGRSREWAGGVFFLLDVSSEPLTING